MVYETETGIFQVAINIDGEWWADDYVRQWMVDLKLNHNNAYNSRNTYANALNIFFHYYVYNKQRYLQSLYDYLLEFRESLRSGFTITSTRTIKTERFTLEKDNYTVFKISPCKIRTINTYMTSIQWYLFFLKERGVENIDSLFKDEVDWEQLKKRSLYGKGGGYGLMMSPLLAQLLGPKRKLIKNLKIPRENSEIDSYFPPELFSQLLEISSPREQAIYLLCGCAGARIGQALSLTRDDYCYDTYQVYIIDPLSDETGPQGTKGRFQLLKDVYNINIEKTPYKEMASKYPIPLQYDEVLWVNQEYKKVFFRVLTKVPKGNPLQNGHPFIFNTKSGKILTPNESYRIFRTKIQKLTVKIEKEWKQKRKNTLSNEKEKIDIEYKYLLNQLNNVKGLHSLRHMYGILWADLAVTNDKINLMELQNLCQYGLGQKSSKSVMMYFTLREKSRKKYMERFIDKSNTMDDYIKDMVPKVNDYFKRKY